MTTMKLGLAEIQAAWRVQAIPDLYQLLWLMPALIRFIGMEPDGKATMTITDYPNKDGKGGFGTQIHVYQPLVDSWAVISTWPHHGFTRINLSSCKSFNPQKVEAWLVKYLGPILKRGAIDI